MERRVTTTLRGVTTQDASRPGSAAGAAMSIVRVYQLLHGNRLSHCRYVPSCSQYALESLDRHGFGRGGWLAVRRLCRCHPFGGYGADPVPD
jgi:uncharacterized protein